MELLSRRRVEGAGIVLDGRTDDALRGEDTGVNVGKGMRNGKLEIDRRGKKGDERVVVMCSVVEEMIFGEERALEKDKEIEEGVNCEIDATVLGSVDGEAEMEDEDADGADEEAAKAEEGRCTGMQGSSSSEKINHALADSARLPGYGAGDRPTQVLDVKSEGTVPEGNHPEIEVSEDPGLTARRLRGQRRAQERDGAKSGA